MLDNLKNRDATDSLNLKQNTDSKRFPQIVMVANLL